MITANGSGLPVPLSFDLEGAADNVSVTVADLNGKEIRTFDVGKKKAGMVNTSWDGRSDTGLVAPAGTYTVTVKATKADGSTVSSTQETTGTVNSVSFDKGYPVLQLSNGVSVQVSDLLRVQK